LYHNGYAYIKDSALKNNNNQVVGYYMKCRSCGSGRVKVMGSIESPSEVEVTCQDHSGSSCEWDVVRYTNDKALGQFKQLIKSLFNKAKWESLFAEFSI
jgi:hypothetical protein